VGARPGPGTRVPAGGRAPIAYSRDQCYVARAVHAGNVSKSDINRYLELQVALDVTLWYVTMERNPNSDFPSFLLSKVTSDDSKRHAARAAAPRVPCVPGDVY
jgi:hypothetical protein